MTAGNRVSSTIYVVDDQPDVGGLVESILQAHDYDCRVYTGPMEAFADYTRAESKPPLLITDFVMDGLNGMELIQKCKQENGALKTILYSGNAGEECMRGYSTQPDYFLSKPFAPKMLVQAVKALLTGGDAKPQDHG